VRPNGDYFAPRDALTIDLQNPGTIYVARQGSGVYKSTDSGVSWRAANLGMTANAAGACCIYGD
jgi:hypothetical protein